MNRIKSRFDLSGKTAIVTGASKGIGEAIARGFAEFGANVVVSSRKQAAVNEVAASFQKDGLSAIGIECHVAYPHMKKQGGGSIMHVSSVEGLHATAMFAAYNISKAALIMLTKNQAAEWGKDNIRVNAICPGFVKTKLSSAIWQNKSVHDGIMKSIPLGRMAEPDEMAGLACFLASDAGSYCTGETHVNDGGIMHAPWY